MLRISKSQLRFLCADHFHPLGAGELPGLGQILFIGELIAFAEEGIQILLREVDVPGGGFHQHLIFHSFNIPFRILSLLYRARSVFSSDVMV